MSRYFVKEIVKIANINSDMFIRAELQAKEQERQQRILQFQNKSLFDLAANS